MKKLFFLLALLLNLGPCFRDGKLTLNSGTLQAQSMGDESTCFLICSATVTISAPCDMVTSIPCPGVTITSPPYTPPTDPYQPPPYIPPIVNPCQTSTADPCACFGHCGPTGPPTTTPPTTPKAPPRVNCAGTPSETISIETTANRNNPGWTNVLNQMKNKLLTPGFNNKEYGAVLQAKSVAGSITQFQYTDTNGGLPFEGGATSINIPMPPCVMGYITTFAQALAHTHPQSAVPGAINLSPPSAADVYNLAQNNAQCPMTKQAYTIAYNGDEYVLTVTNRASTTAFLATNPPATTLDPVNKAGFYEYSKIGADFELAKARFLIDGYSIHDAAGLATAYVLSKYNTGITLLRKDSDGKFKQITITATESGGKTTYTITMCK